MTSIELLESFVVVKDNYVLEAHGEAMTESNIIPYHRSTKSRRRMPMKRRFLIAALVAMMLLLMGCAIVLMKLQEMKVGDWAYTYPEHAQEMAGETVTSELISMQGFMDSPNYQASKEWSDFLKTYDPEGKLLDSEKTGSYQPSMEYMAYTCYTQEMQEKLDEICERYELNLLGPVYAEEYPVDIVKAVGIENVFAETANIPTEIYDGYYYGDGTFQISGTNTLNYEGSPWIYPTSYQYRCVMKSSFDGVLLPVGDIEAFEEWNYTLQDGTEVLLALSTEKALIIVDKPEYFVTINILETRVGDVLYGEQQMSREGLEAFAETFTFDYVPGRPNPDTLVEPEWYTQPGNGNEGSGATQGDESEREALSEMAVLTAYEAFLSGDRAILEESQMETWWIPNFHADGLEYEYTYLDLDGDGMVELLVQMIEDPGGYNGVFHFEDGKLYCWNSDGTEMSCRDYPLKNGFLVRQYDYNGTSSYTIFRYLGDGTIEEAESVFSREELEEPSSTEPCSYYEIDGKEVSKVEFEEWLTECVTTRLLERTAWTAL